MAISSWILCTTSANFFLPDFLCCAWEVVGDDEASKLQPWPAESRFPLIQVNSWERHGLSKERQRDYACILNASDAEANARDDRKEFGVHGAKLMQDWSSFNGSWCARALTGHWWRRKPS